MPFRLETSLKSELFDAEGEGLRQKAKNYFGIKIDRIRTVHVLTIDADLSDDQLKTIQTEIFTNPVTQVSSFDPLPIEFDWTIWVGYRPGVRDNPGSTAVEAIEDILGYIPCRGFEAKYYDRRKNKLLGGKWDYLTGKNQPYKNLLHYRANMLWDAIGYLKPQAVFGQ